MKNRSVFGVATLAAAAGASGCVHVIEKEVIVEKPVYITANAATGSCSTAAPVQASNSFPAASFGELTARGSAGSLVSLPASSIVAMQVSMGLGPGMTLDERERLEKKVQTVLENDSDGAGIRWVSKDSGAVFNMMASDSQQEKRLVTVARGEEVGRLPDSLVVEPAIYVTTQDATLRPTPSPTSIVSGGTVPAGAKMRVLGRVSGINSDSWMLVGGPDGTAFGYVEPSQLRPNETNLVPTREIYTRATGTRIRDSVSASVMCRTLSYGSGEFEDVMRTCREPGGRWISNPPVLDADNMCSAQPQPSFLLDK